MAVQTGFTALLFIPGKEAQKRSLLNTDLSRLPRGSAQKARSRDTLSLRRRARDGFWKPLIGQTRAMCCVLFYLGQVCEEF